MRTGKKNLYTLWTAFVLGVILAILMTLGGCTPKEASENEIQQALLQSSPYTDYFDSETSVVEDFAITKRQTSPENGTDVVWVSISAKDDEKSAQLSYIMTYILYNDGWQLEELSRDMESTWIFSPLQGPSDELIKENLPSDLTEFSTETDLEGKNATVTFTVENNRGYCITTYAKQVSFGFNWETGVWSPTENRILATQNDFSPIEGTAWEYLEETDKTDRDGDVIYKGAYLGISSINPVTLEATGKLIVYRAEYPYGHSAKNWIVQGGYEMDLSDVVFRFEGESLIMVEYASDESKYKHVEFISGDDGNFSVMVCPRDDNFNKYWEGSEYYLERLQEV